jgi:hypothetical protein
MTAPIRFEEGMKIFAFTKTGLIRIVAASLMLSVYVITIILNFATHGYSSGNFFATVFFCIALTMFSVFAKLKNHPPLLWATRGWLIVSVTVFFLGIIFSLTDVQLGGLFGGLIGSLFVIISPYFGLYYMIDIDLMYADVMLGIIGIISCVMMWLIPEMTEKAIRRRMLIKKYR